MSIGSNTNGGVRAVRVTDLTIDGADNGLRIKSNRSRGGLVEDVAYEDGCMRNVPNPIVLTSMYTPLPGPLLPLYRDTRLEDVRERVAPRPAPRTPLHHQPDHPHSQPVPGREPDRDRAGHRRAQPRLPAR